MMGDDDGENDVGDNDDNDDKRKTKRVHGDVPDTTPFRRVILSYRDEWASTCTWTFSECLCVCVCVCVCACVCVCMCACERVLFVCDALVQAREPDSPWLSASHDGQTKAGLTSHFLW